MKTARRIIASSLGIVFCFVLFSGVLIAEESAKSNSDATEKLKTLFETVEKPELAEVQKLLDAGDEVA